MSALNHYVAVIRRETDALRTQRDVAEAEVRALREALWLRHGCPTSALYGDDGEMQCARHGDFKREPIATITARFEAEGRALAARREEGKDGG